MNKIPDITLNLSGCLLALATVVAVLLIPFALVWSLNVLFPVLAIPYNIKTWLAALILMAIMKSRSVDNTQKR